MATFPLPTNGFSGGFGSISRTDARKHYDLCTIFRQRIVPIFYPVELVPERLQWVLEINPLSSMVEEVRGATLFGQWPDWTAFGWNLLIAFVICRLGLCWFLKTKKGFADVL